MPFQYEDASEFKIEKTRVLPPIVLNEGKGGFKQEIDDIEANVKSGKKIVEKKERRGSGRTAAEKNDTS